MSKAMHQLKTITRWHLVLHLGLLSICCSLTCSAYQQGSYLLFVIADGEKSESTAEVIAVAPSVFKSKIQMSKTDTAAKAEKSEFETEITSLRSDDGKSVTTGIEILDHKKDISKSESAFDQSPPASSGFFFNY